MIKDRKNKGRDSQNENDENKNECNKDVRTIMKTNEMTEVLQILSLNCFLLYVL